MTYEQPYLLARTLMTLDHFTNGRVVWNIVTSYVDSAARNLGLEGQIPHDERYDRAEEYMDVIYRLFEDSFTPEALRADAEATVIVDAEATVIVDAEATVIVDAEATVIADDTDEAAEARLADCTRCVDTESALASLATMAGDKTWTIRDLAEFVAIDGFNIAAATSGG